MAETNWTKQEQEWSEQVIIALMELRDADHKAVALSDAEYLHILKGASLLIEAGVLSKICPPIKTKEDTIHG